MTNESHTGWSSWAADLGNHVWPLSARLERRPTVVRLQGDPAAAEDRAVLWQKRPGALVSRGELMDAIWPDTAITPTGAFRLRTGLLAVLERMFDEIEHPSK